LLFSEDKKPVNPDATAPSSISKAEPAKVEPVIQPPAPVVVGTATLTLAIAPWGEVFVDGESRGVSPPMVSLEVAAGKRQIEVKNDGASSYSTEIEFKAGEVKRLKYKF
jgi:serine/threonine-protein kinase